MKKQLIFGILLLIAFNAMANNIQKTEIAQSHAEYFKNQPYEQLSKIEKQRIASVWHVSVKDYQHYKRIMKNSPARNWYKKLDPVEVLGMTSANDKERMKYALIQAKLDIQRVTSELAYQRVYTAAVKSLLPNVKPIEWDRKKKS